MTDTTAAPAPSLPAERAASFALDGPVDVAVLVVTYNSADDLDALIDDLRRETAGTRIRVIVADNSSSDDTWAVAGAHPDVVRLRTGGNLGYAAGVNAATTRAGDAEAILVLNPDLRLVPGVIATLLARLRSDPSIGAVVPRIDDADGHLHHSLRREPTAVRAVSDAVWGRAWRSRPAALSEHVRTDAAYAEPAVIDWATGAALLIRTRAARSVGDWDERFFLYSEETDFQRRLRGAGWRIWFEPSARVVHRGGGSGVSDELVALTIVNRVRYADKHLGRSAGLFRAAVVVGEELRRDPTHARARWALRRRARWAALPRAQKDAAPGDAEAPASPGAVTIDHVFVTRFNLPTAGPESLVRARDGWLRERVDLFERHTVPSVQRQHAPGLAWIVYLDPESPTWLLERLAPAIAAGMFTPLYREEVGWADVARDARAVTGARGDLLVTTNLDNDDALADDFAARVQALARQHGRSAIYLSNGLIARGDELYGRRDDHNAFCSVAESWEAPGTAWRDWHTLLGRHYPVVTDRGAPGWLQVVHGGNVSNRVRGLRTSPSRHRALFGAELDVLPEPGLGVVLVDRLVRAPLRGAREVARSAAKNLVLHVFGKATVDRVKDLLSARQSSPRDAVR
ncbi:MULTISPECIES: glycosyltransferase [unclassified Microbacterium]|uniref:glycosyltransferase n=1 Tax=unclassified Microbacterium TaxID=2609290 RepID=UPI00386FBFE1